MGTVHLAQQLGDAGFARMVAIKFLHPHLAAFAEFVARFLDEARLAARIRHPNVVATIDVVEEAEKLCLVMEYVRGESVATLAARAAEEGELVPPVVAVRIVTDMLRGLHAAHVATDEGGTPLEIIHRDVSPQNVLVSLDGTAHLLDFGIAKAAGSLHTTTEGHLKGKLRYMAPEQIVEQEATPRTDVYAAAVVLWELLAGRKLFEAANDAARLAKVLEGAVLPPSHFARGSPELDAVVLRGLERDPAARYPTAEAMALDLERVFGVTPVTEVAAWVERIAGATVRGREAMLASPSETAQGETTSTATEQAPLDRTAPLLAPEPSPRAPARASERASGGGGRRRVTVVLAAVALAAIATLAVAAPRVLRRHDRAPEPVGPGLEATASFTTSSAAPAIEATTSSSVPAASAGLAPPSTLSAPRRPASTLPNERSQTSAPVKDRGTRRDCATPYYQDPSGIRRVKRECL
jgi:serine/threonine-protein kinase